MVKKSVKSEKSDTPAAAAKPAVRRTRTAKAAAPAAAKRTATPAAAQNAAPARRATSPRPRKSVAVSADRGLTAAASAIVAVPLAVEAPTHDEIATRAYFIHLDRRATPGNPEADWLLAIEELRRERGLI
jgi:hypothetical protein